MEKIEDDTALIRYGQTVERELTNSRESHQFFSAWNDYPDEENRLGLYQYGRVIVMHSMDMIIHNRETYGFLEWIGDIGGVLEGLTFFLTPFTASYAAIAI